MLRHWGTRCSCDKNRHGLLGLTVKRLFTSETTETTIALALIQVDKLQCSQIILVTRMK